MTALRLFTALEIPTELQALLVSLRTEMAGAVWTRPAALHLTLKFLGDGIAEARVPPLIAALNGVQGAGLTLAAAGVGRLPPGERQAARVLWAGLATRPALFALAAAVDEAASTVGFAPETHPFMPHITLAYLKRGADKAEAAQFLRQHAGLRSAPFHADHFTLFASELTPQGARYTALACFPLAG